MRPYEEQLGERQIFLSSEQAPNSIIPSTHRSQLGGGSPVGRALHETVREEVSEEDGPDVGR